jgi:hypothetical protein
MHRPLPYHCQTLSSSGAGSLQATLIIAYYFGCGFVDDKPVKKAACNTAENRRKPKEPQLAQQGAAPTAALDAEKWIRIVAGSQGLFR